MKRMAIWMMVGVLGTAFGRMSESATIVSDTWTAGAEGWANKEAAAEGPGYGTLNDGVSQSWLKITRTAVNPVERDFIYGNTPLADPVAGTVDYSDIGGKTVRSIRFNFYADADGPGGGVDAPALLYLYFASNKSGNRNVWYYTINPSQVTGGWGSYGANIDHYDYGAWWIGGEGDYADWQLDFENVYEVGILLGYQSPVFGLQTYGIDDFILDDELLPVPEPQTWMFLAMAVTCLMVGFRDRLHETLAWVRSYAGERWN